MVPERSLGNEQWEFTLGKCPPASSGGFTPPPQSVPGSEQHLTFLFWLS